MTCEGLYVDRPQKILEHVDTFGIGAVACRWGMCNVIGRRWAINLTGKGQDGSIHTYGTTVVFAVGHHHLHLRRLEKAAACENVALRQVCMMYGAFGKVQSSFACNTSSYMGMSNEQEHDMTCWAVGSRLGTPWHWKLAVFTVMTVVNKTIMFGESIQLDI